MLDKPSPKFPIAITALRTWAALGTGLRPQRPPPVRWYAVQRLIEAARTKLKGDAERLRQLLQKSKEILDPLEDPLQVDLGLHRWLSGEREEAYSDWLQWVLVQVSRPNLIFPLFGLKAPQGWENGADLKPEVRREVWVAKGHPGHSGRLDIVVDYSTFARLIIEVKKTGAEEADTKKGSGYEQSQQAEAIPGKCYEYVLLATTGDFPEYAGRFRFRSWADVCVELRRIVPRLRDQVPLITLAMILAFVGAVEQNLLGFSQKLVSRIIKGQLALFSPAIVDHLQESTSGGHNGR